MTALNGIIISKQWALKETVMEKEECQVGPKINPDVCDGCETCVDVCPADVFEMEDGKANVVRKDDCLDCGACTEECPANAINLDG